MSRISRAGDLDAIIKSLTQQRQADIGRIEGLFDQFGVTARQDLETTLKKAGASQERDLIRRGLSQTTRFATGRTDLAEKGARGRARIDEQVAGQKAGFLERQLVDPSLITSLISQAAAVDTTPRNIQVGASNVGAPTFGLRPGDPGTGGGGGSSGSPGISSFGLRGGSSSPGQGARVIPSPNAAPTQGTTPGTTRGARVISGAQTASAGSTAGQASLRSGQASGTGSIRSTATGQGFETRTGQAQPNAIGAAATDASPAASQGGSGGRTITIQAGVNARGAQMGTKRTVTVPAGVSNVQAITSGAIPWGWRIIG